MDVVTDPNVRRERAVRRVVLEFEKKDKVATAHLRGSARQRLWQLSEGYVNPDDVTYVATASAEALKKKGVEVIG